MILVAGYILFFDCYVKNISTQMELLKLMEANKVLSV